MKDKKKAEALKIADLIFRYRNGNASMVEKEALKREWIEMLEKNIVSSILRYQHEFLWDEVDKLRGYDANAAFNRFQSKISNPKEEKKNNSNN